MRRSISVLFAGIAAALLVAVSAPAQAAVVISSGHVDVVDIEYENSELDLILHDESVEPPVERDPADVVLEALPGAKTTVPDDPQYAFLGSAGSDVWILPQTQDPALLWAGFSAEELPGGVFAGDKVTLKLVSVAGPAGSKLAVFDTDPFGSPVVIYDSASLPGSFEVPTGLHHHSNWGFTKAGDYTLTFQASGTLTDGTVKTSPAVAYHFQVDA